MCRELTDLGMDVARAAAREAVANLNTPIEHPIPGAHVPPVCRVADPGRLFTRAAYAVRQAIALENRIVAGDFAPLRDVQHQPRSPGSPPAPGTHTTPRGGFRAETLESLCPDFSAGSDDRPVEQILAAIRQILGLAPDQPMVDRPPLTPIEPAPPPSRLAPPRALRRQAPKPPPRPG